jgi:7-cyano-7-deazaguanine synthase
VTGRTPKAKAVILLSGGLDSAACLAAARAQGFACTALSFDYGQRHRVELVAAAAVAHQLGAVDHRVIAIDLRAIGGSALTSELAVPKGQPLMGDIPVTYVPARNLVFLSLAAGLGETLGARDLFIGVNAVDYSGYPDCRPQFIESFERTVNLGTRAGALGAPFKVHTPLIALSKAEIIRLGARLGVDFALTASCYDPDEVGRACGRCESCQIRRRGFAEAEVPDPTAYAPSAAPEMAK